MADVRERLIPSSAPSQAHGESGFWSRVDQRCGPNACWPWLGARRGDPVIAGTQGIMGEVEAQLAAALREAEEARRG